MAKVTINLFGAAGQRAIEIQPKGGFPTRHINIGTSDKTPLPEITPDLPKAQPATSSEKALPKPTLRDETERDREIVKALPDIPYRRPITLDDFIDALAKMQGYKNKYRYSDLYLSFSEITKVCGPKLRFRISDDLILEMLRTLYKQGRILQKKNQSGQDCFLLVDPPDKPKTDLQALLAEVDAILAKGENNDL